MKYGAILRACRDRAGFSQEELAHKLHINQSDVSKYENGTKEPTMSLFYEWASNTQAVDVLIAFMCGVDGIGMMQQIMDSATTLISTIFLGGF